MKNVIEQLGLGLILLTADLANNFPIDNFFDKLSFRILAIFVMPSQLPSHFELLKALLALNILGWSGL